MSVRQLRKLVKQNPNDARAWYELGVALAGERELAETHKALLRALGCPSSDGRLRDQIGISLEKLNDLDAAIDAYRLACHALPTAVDPHMHLGEALIKRGDVRGGITALRRAVALSDYGAHECLRLATALEIADNTDAALSFFHIAAHRSPSSVDAHRNLGRALGEAGHVHGAVRAWKSVVDLAPGEIPALGELGVALSNAGQHAESVRVLAEVARLRPHSAGAFSDLATALTRGGSHDMAVQTARRATELDPASPEIKLNLGDALMESGAYEEAMGVFSELIAQAPRWGTAHFHLAKALQQLGDLRAAREVLITASTLSPQDAEIQAALREVVVAHSIAPAPVQSSPFAATPVMRGKESEPTQRAAAMALAADLTDEQPERYLSGDLEIFPLVEVLEFLKVHGSNGILKIDAPRGKASVHLIGGNVLEVVYPGALNVIELLHKNRSPTIRLDPQDGTHRPPLTIAIELVDRGVIDRDALDAAIYKQLKTGLMELIGWHDGNFTFHEDHAAKNHEPPSARFAIDTRFLLMEVLRGIDEKNAGRPSSGS